MKIFLLLFLSNAFAIDRIETKGLNQLEPHKIFMTYGRSTVILLPCNVISFSDGPTRDIQGQLNERNSKMIEVWFTKNSPQPQELKVFCQEERFVFDIMPNQTTHQSIFEVNRSFRSKKIEVAINHLDSTQIQKPKILKVIKSSTKDF